MHKIVELILSKKLVIQIFLLILIVLGLYSLSLMHREAFPNVTLDKVVIETVLPGATSEEIERLITIPIEKKLRSVPNIEKVRSYNLENVSVIMVFLVEGLKNSKVVVDEIKDEVNSVQLPQNAIKPNVKEITTQKQQVVDIAISLSNADYFKDEGYRTIRDIAKKIEDDLYQLKEVAEIEKFGYRNREFSVEVDPLLLDSKQIGLNSILNALGGRNIDLPSGIIKVEGNEYLLRTKGQFEEAKDMENLPIVGNEMGYTTKLKDVAKVFDTFEEIKIYEKVNGKSSIILRVWKTDQADIISVARKVRQLIENKKEKYPKVEITLFEDKSIDVVRQLTDLILNFFTGLSLVVLVLVIILGLRLSLIISIAIPLIFLLSFILIKQADLTLNTISIFGLVMVLGMMVDNSIVFAENTYRLMQEGLKRSEAINQTFKEVFAPLIVSYLVISSAFVPLLFLSGIIGKFIVGIPIVILFTLFTSLLFSLVFLSNWLDIFLPEKLKATHKHNESDEKQGVFSFLISSYKATMSWVLKHKWIALGIFNVFFFGMIFAAGKFLPFMMFPPGGEEEIEVKTWMPIGTTLESNLEVINTLEPIFIEMAGKSLEYIRTRVGIHESPAIDPKPGQESHRARLLIKLVPETQRKEEWKTAKELTQRMKDKIEQLKENNLIPRSLFIDINAIIKGPPVGKPVNLEIRGEDYSKIKEIAELYIQELKKIDGVYNILLDLEAGKEEYRFHINDELASKTEVSARDIGRSIRTAYNGEIASTISKGEDKINIMVRFPKESRYNSESLKYVKVENRNRRLIPLDSVTYLTRERSYSMINRQDLLRIVRLEASVDTKITTSLAVNTQLQKSVKLGKEYEGYTVNFGGEQEDSNKSFKDMVVAMGFAVAVIFIIFITYFNSVGTTFVILASIPFGIIGVLLALLIHFQPLSFMSMLAIVSLSGSIVANTLMLITFIEDLRKNGVELEEAIIQGGAIRLRPIFLTTITTVIGLVPSAYGIPTLDRFVQPLSLAFGWGLIFATAVTLVLVPVLYRIKEEIKIRRKKFIAKSN